LTCLVASGVYKSDDRACCERVGRAVSRAEAGGRGLGERAELDKG